MHFVVMKRRVNIPDFHVEAGIWATSHLENIDHMNESNELRGFTFQKNSVQQKAMEGISTGSNQDKDHMRTIPWTFSNCDGIIESGNVQTRLTDFLEPWYQQSWGEQHELIQER
jgi:hypothetical protein